MINEKAKYLYSSRNILKIGAICVTIFSCVNLTLGLIVIYLYPQNAENNIKLVLWRMIFIFGTYLITALLVYYKRENLEKAFPVWLSLPLLGFLFLFLETFGYITIYEFLISLNCSTAEVSGCTYLSDTQLVLSVAVAFILGFAVTTGLIFLIGFISDLFQKKLHLK